jgi:hypothetical protein
LLWTLPIEKINNKKTVQTNIVMSSVPENEIIVKISAA